MTSAVRGLAVIAISLAAVAAVCGLIPSIDIVTYDAAVRAQLHTERAGGLGHVLFLLVCAWPAIRVLRAPTSRALAAWTITGWFVGLPYFAVATAGAHCAWHVSHLGVAARVCQLATPTVAVIATIGAPIAGWLAAAARRAPSARVDSVLGHRLRRLVQLAFAIGVVISAFGFLPGAYVYGGGDGSTVTTQLAGGLPLALFVAVLLAPGALVYADPQLRFAWLWSLWALPASVVAGLATMDFSWHAHVEVLWTRRLVEGGLGTLLALLLLVLPMVWIVSRDRDDELPPARLIKG